MILEMETDIALIITGLLAIIICIVMAFIPRWCIGQCTSTAMLDGKTVIITGSNTGIGKETARDLAKRGAHIIMACRNQKKAEAAAEEIRLASKGKVTVCELDLASFRSIRAFAEKILQMESKIHILINNAGVMMCPYMETEEGFEMQFGTNFLGHFLLTTLLLDRIKQSAPARIINVSSLAHKSGKMNWNDLNLKKNYSPLQAYCQSKLANVLFTKELAKRLEGTGVTCYALHPGVVHTELGRYMDVTTNRFIAWLFENIGKVCFKTSVQGAQTTIFCAVAEEVAHESGLYYRDCAKKLPATQARDEASAEKLWNIGMTLIDADYPEQNSSQQP